jgi:hypothetical protein
LDLRSVGPVDGEVGVEEIPSVVGGLGGDGVLLAFPVEDAGIVDAVGEVFILNSAVEKTKMATITPLPELVGRYFRVLVG